MGFMSLLSSNLKAFSRRASIAGLISTQPCVSVATPAQNVRTCLKIVSERQKHPIENSLFTCKQTELFEDCLPSKPALSAAQPVCTRTVKTNQRAGTHSNARVGRLVLSGRMSDVCAELDRLIALEHGLFQVGTH